MTATTSQLISQVLTYSIKMHEL